MAKEKEEKEVVAKTDRELRWEQFLEKHKAQNPAKHQARLDAGELNEIPSTFV